MTDSRSGSCRGWGPLPLLGVAALLVATLGVFTEVAQADPGCAPLQSGRYIGTWQTTGGSLQGTVMNDMTVSGSLVTGTIEQVTGTTVVAAGDPLTGTLTGCVLAVSSGNVFATGIVSESGLEVISSFSYFSTTGTSRVGLVTDSVTTTGTSGATGGGTSSADPVGTGVVSPTPGTIVIDEALSTGGSFAGYSLFDTLVRIEAPDATSAAPLELTFTLDSSATGGAAASAVMVFRNGVLLTDCTGAPQAVPDPCVSAREDLAGGASRITVLTSHASTWNFAAVPATVPGAPAIIKNATAGNAEATVSWTAPASDGGSPITGYSVTPYVGLFPLPSQTSVSTATAHTVTGLTNGVGYRFKVAAINAIGTGPASTVSNQVTPAPPTVPAAPTIGTAAAGNAQATVTWTGPASDGGSPIIGYIVTPYIGYLSQGPRYFLSASTNQTVTGLTNGTTYRFKVRAWNAIGVSDFSKSSNAVIPS